MLLSVVLANHCSQIFFPEALGSWWLIQTGPGHLNLILKEGREAKKGRVKEKGYDRQTCRATVC